MSLIFCRELTANSRGSVLNVSQRLGFVEKQEELLTSFVKSMESTLGYMNQQMEINLTVKIQEGVARELDKLTTSSTNGKDDHRTIPNFMPVTEERPVVLSVLEPTPIKRLSIPSTPCTNTCIQVEKH